MAILIVLCFVSVLMLSTQSRASYPTYILALLMLITVPRWKDVFQLDLTRWISALLLWLCLSTFWSDPFVLRDAVSVWTRALLVFMFVVAFGECQLRGQLQRWMGVALTVVGAMATLAAIVNFYITNPLDGRLNGLGQLDTHVVAALVYGVLILFVLYSAATLRAQGWRVLAICVALIMALAIWLSDSRNAWVSVSLGVFVFVLAHRLVDRQRFFALLAVVGVVSIAAMVVVLQDDSMRAVILPRGDSFRLAIWQEVLVKVGQAPLFGLGITTSDDVNVPGFVLAHPHNMYLSVLHQGGIVALGLYAIVLYKTIVGVLLKHYSSPDAKLALAILALALSAHMLDEHELIDKVGATWFLIWLPIAIALGLQWRKVSPVIED